MFIPIFPFSEDGNYCYLVTYHWEGLLTRKIISLRKGFYDIPGQNGDLSNFTGFRNSMGDNSDCGILVSSKRSSDNIF